MRENRIIKYEGGLVQHVGKSIAITNKLLAIPDLSINIMYLSPWPLLGEGIKKFVIPKIPGASIVIYIKSSDALTHIKSAFENGAPINLILTELSNAEMNGYEFARKVRELDNEYGKKTHIILLTLFSQDDPLITKGLTENIFDKYLSKTVSSAELIDYIKAIS